MAEYIDPLNLRKIFVEYFLGDQNLFAVAFILIIGVLCAKFGIPDRLTMILIAISSVIMGASLGQLWYSLILFLVGFALYKMFSRVWE